MIWVVYRNEMLKMTKRLAFWVTLLSAVFMQLMTSGGRFYSSRQNPDLPQFSLPESIAGIFSSSVQMALIFGPAALILLVTSEFSWRTARQSVIDGLSKNQFFVGKLLLIPTLGMIFLSTQLAIGVGFAIPATDFGNLSGPLFKGVYFLAIAGFLLAFIGAAAVALFFALAIRSSGPAIAAWFFWTAIVEGLLASVAKGASERLGEMAEFAPGNVIDQMARYLQYDKDAFAAAVSRALERGVDPPSPAWDWPVLLVWFALWVAVLLLVSFVWFSKRDL